MKKKWIAVLLALAMATACTACGEKQKSEVSPPGKSEVLPTEKGDNGEYWDPSPQPAPETPEKGIPQNAEVFHHRQLLSNEGYPVVSTYLPDDWYEAAVTMNYRYSTRFPIHVITAMETQDGSCGIIYYSPMSFMDSTNLSDGKRTPDDGSNYILDYCTYYHYRDAYEVSDLALSLLGYSWQERDSMPVAESLVREYDTAARQTAEQAFREQKRMMAGYNIEKLELENVCGTIDRSRGTISNGNGAPLYAETYVCAKTQTIDYVVQSFPQLNMRMGNVRTQWQYDGFFLYWAQDEETFNANYDKAQFIIANTGTSKSLAAAQEQYLSIVIPMIIQGREDAMNYGANIVRQVMTGWNDTNERVAQQWDDYILDQNRYISSDGSEFTVPTTADYVYYDSSNDSILWTDSALADPGPGYEQLNRKY